MCNDCKRAVTRLLTSTVTGKNLNTVPTFCTQKQRASSSQYAPMYGQNIKLDKTVDWIGYLHVKCISLVTTISAILQKHRLTVVIIVQKLWSRGT